LESNEKDINKALELFVVLSRAYNSVAENVARDIRKHSLNTTEFGVLELLYSKGQHPLQQIGDKILLSSGSITYVVDKLEKKGYLIRKPCDKDRRIIYAAITEAGKQLMDSIFPAHAEVIRDTVSGLVPAEQEMAAYLLKKLGKHAQSKL
jgi:MarR family transcriptional regulator, 2-MHQ and catechol-resistance regulon repressor